MEKFDLGNKITLDEKEFLIIEKLAYNEKNYLHLLNIESKMAEIFEVKVNDETNEIKIQEELDEEIKAEILIEILEKSKDIDM